MSQLIYSFDTQATPSLSEVGGKSLSLILTTRAGLPVPGGLARTVDFFDAWTERIKATPKWLAYRFVAPSEEGSKTNQDHPSATKDEDSGEGEA